MTRSLAAYTLSRGEWMRLTALLLWNYAALHTVMCGEWSLGMSPANYNVELCSWCTLGTLYSHLQYLKGTL